MEAESSVDLRTIQNAACARQDSQGRASSLPSLESGGRSELAESGPRWAPGSGSRPAASRSPPPSWPGPGTTPSPTARAALANAACGGQLASAPAGLCLLGLAALAVVVTVLCQGAPRAQTPLTLLATVLLSLGLASASGKHRARNRGAEEEPTEIIEAMNARQDAVNEERARQVCLAPDRCVAPPGVHGPLAPEKASHGRLLRRPRRWR